MTTWDANFEATPADTDEAKYGANEIRTLKTAISERLEMEMNFKTGTQPLLKAGIAGVCFAGNQTDIANLSNVANSNVANGALAYDNTNYVIQHYWEGAWSNMVIYHNELGNKANGDDHPQYLKLDKEDQTITANVAVDDDITIDGVDISAANGSLANHIANSAANGHTAGIGEVLGAWVTSNTVQNIYTANTDGVVVASVKAYEVSLQTPSGTNIAVMTASSNHYVLSVSGVVKKGDTWRVYTLGVNSTFIPLVRFIPLGS